MSTVGRAEIKVVADARGFAGQAEREIQSELDKINVHTDKINKDIDRNVQTGMLTAARNGLQSFGIILQGGISVSAAGAFGLSILAALVPAAIAAGVAAGGALVLAFGGALAGIGLVVQSQNREVQKEFSALKDRVIETLEEITLPFQGVLLRIVGIAGDVFKDFTPTLAEAFQTIALPLSRFARDVGDAFLALEPTIQPVADAFAEILEELGPSLANDIFPGIAAAIINIADSISEHADVFVGLIEFFAGLVESVLNFIAILIDLANWFQEHPAAIVAALAAVGVAILILTSGLAGIIAAAVAFGFAIVSMWDEVMAANEFARKLFFEVLNAIAKFFTDAWNSITSRITQARATIQGILISIGTTINNFVASVGRWFTNLGRTIVNWAVNFRNTIKSGIDSVVSFFRGLPGRISAAISSLADRIFSPFRRGINRIISGWNRLSFSIGGGSIFGIDIPRVTISTPNIPLLQRGGVIDRAGGVIVGENGAELLELPRGAQVTPLDQADNRGVPDEFEATAVIDLGEGIREVVNLMFRKVNRRAYAGVGRAR